MILTLQETTCDLTLTMTLGAQVISGTAAQRDFNIDLTAGTHKILFAEPYANTDYALTYNVLDASGVPNAYYGFSKDLDGFNISLNFPSIIDYIAL